MARDSTSKGLVPAAATRFPDEHYHRWPRRMTTEDLAGGKYIRPLSAKEELALFLEFRGHCLADNGRFAEARAAYEDAHAAASNWSDHANHLSSLELHEAMVEPAADPRPVHGEG